jgi:Non-ribosomal peptide synthetase modules and related proteins
LSILHKNIEDTYPLSPLQEGMLFHALYAPESEVYFEQLSGVLGGKLQAGGFKWAWQQVVNRHPILRTAFVWKNLEKPMQVVGRRVGVLLEQQDWRDLAALEQEERLEAYLKADRRRGFQLFKAPLMRLALFQVAEDTYHFVLSFHHLLLDGWSLSLVLKEVLACYEAFRGDQELRLERPRPYRDYIAWLQQQDLAQAERFWREALRGLTAPTPLGVDRGVWGRERAPRYAEQGLELSAAVTGQLRALAREHRLTLNTLVQGAWALLLSRYSGEEEVVFGATVAGRPAGLVGVEAMVGLFINTLPVRVEVPSQASLLPWLQQLQGRQVEREQYAYSPLVAIQGWSEVPRGVPLFESLVVFENYPVEASLTEQRDGVQIREVRAVEWTNYPLTVVAAAPGAELALKVSYEAARFEVATITRLLGHLQTLFGGMVAQPEQRLTELPLLSEAERRQVVVEWNATQSAYPQERCIHQLFEAQVEQAPEVVAAVFEDQQLTYRALNTWANQLAHYLQALGVGPEGRVGICMERSVEMVVGLLGILKAGGAYVPLDPAYPKERLVFMVEDAQVPVLLTQARLAPTLPKTTAQVVCLDREWERISKEPQCNPPSSVIPEDLAYVIYTSGSTGRPKGVLVPHRGLLNLAFWHQGAFEITSSDRATQLAGTAFDASVWEIWPYLSKGASLYIVDSEILNSPVPLRDWLVSKAVTISFLPTPLAEMVLPLEWPEAPALRILLTGGDKLHHYPSPSVPFQDN